MVTFIQIDIFLAIIFFTFLVIFLLKNKKNVAFEKQLFPLIYAFLFRGKFGINWMKKFVQKHKELIKLFGYSSIGFGFVGMFLAIGLILYVAYEIFINLSTQSVAPFLPFVEIPVFGRISFMHWIITLFVIVIVHEAAHGIVALAHGLKIKNTGFGVFALLIPFAPLAFVEPDEEELKKQPDVVQHSIFAAGPMSNFLLVIPILLILILISMIEAPAITLDGFSFDVIENTSFAAYDAQISSGLIFNTVNGVSMVSANTFFQKLQLSQPGEILSLAYMNESTGDIVYSYNITLGQNPTLPTSGFLGITNIKQEFTLRESYEPFWPFLQWLRSLFFLMGNISFSLGVINLFPAAVTDGGRMFQLAIDKIGLDKKKNKIIVGFFALLFLIVIVASLIGFFL